MEKNAIFRLIIFLATFCGLAVGKIVRVYNCDLYCGDGQYWPLTQCCERHDFFGKAGGECQGAKAFCDIGL
ncbi:unnamed protein product, partial [Mesorhabditis spiculigera]